MKGIYKIESPSGKVYVGQSNNIKRRFIEHKSYTSRTNTKLGSAIRSYGFDNLNFSVLYECNCQSGRNILENVIIDVNNLTEKGLNHLDGGESFSSNPFKGKSHSESFKKRMSELRKGVAPKNAIKKISKPVYCDFTGKEYSSLSACARDVGVSQPLISMMIHGKTPDKFGLKFI